MKYEIIGAVVLGLIVTVAFNVKTSNTTSKELKLPTPSNLIQRLIGLIIGTCVGVLSMWLSNAFKPNLKMYEYLEEPPKSKTYQFMFDLILSLVLVVDIGFLIFLGWKTFRSTFTPDSVDEDPSIGFTFMSDSVSDGSSYGLFYKHYEFTPQVHRQEVEKSKMSRHEMKDEQGRFIPVVGYAYSYFKHKVMAFYNEQGRLVYVGEPMFGTHPCKNSDCGNTYRSTEVPTYLFELRHSSVYCYQCQEMDSTRRCTGVDCMTRGVCLNPDLVLEPIPVNSGSYV